MVLNGWEIKSLKDITSKIQDGNYGAKYPKADELVDQGIPFLTSKALGGSGKTNPEKYDFITIEKHTELKKAHITTNDILFTNRGANVGVIGLAGKDLSDANIGPQLTLIRSNEKLVSYNYLYFFMKSSFFQRQVQGQDSGSAMNFFGIKSTEQFKIKIPPLPEQQKIAKILSTWDKAISTTERLIDNSTQQKKALMQQLLTGKKRLLDESDKKFDGEFNQHRLIELVNIDKKSLGKNTPENYEFEYISLSDVSTGTISKSLERHVFSSAPSRARRIVKENDLLLATVRPNLKGFAKARKEHDGFVTSTGFAVLSAKKDVSSDYIYHYLFSHHLTGQINALVVGSNYPAINSSDVGSLKILCPPLEEQQKIATVLTNADKEIELLKQQLVDLQQEKKALMQVLLTGKVRVLVNG